MIAIKLTRERERTDIDFKFTLTVPTFDGFDCMYFRSRLLSSCFRLKSLEKGS